jgi:hypothetical protein
MIVEKKKNGQTLTPERSKASFARETAIVGILSVQGIP